MRIVQRGLEAEETKNLLSSVRSFSPKEREVLVPSSAESLEIVFNCSVAKFSGRIIYRILVNGSFTSVRLLLGRTCSLWGLPRSLSRNHPTFVNRGSYPAKIHPLLLPIHPPSVCMYYIAGIRSGFSSLDSKFSSP